MKKLLSLGLALLVGVSMFGVYTSPAWAGTMGQGACPWNEAWGKAFDPSGLVGALVLSRDLEELGRVVDVNVAASPEEGGVNLLLVSSCLPGMEGRLVAVPYDSFSYYDRQEYYEVNQKIDSVDLNISTKEFREDPSFSSDSGR